MSATTVRVDSQARDRLRKLAEEQQCSMRTILELAIDSCYRQLSMEKLNAGFAALCADPEA